MKRILNNENEAKIVAESVSAIRLKGKEIEVDINLVRCWRCQANDEVFGLGVVN